MSIEKLINNSGLSFFFFVGCKFLCIFLVFFVFMIVGCIFLSFFFIVINIFVVIILFVKVGYKCNENSDWVGIGNFFL